MAFPFSKNWTTLAAITFVSIVGVVSVCRLKAGCSVGGTTASSSGEAASAPSSAHVGTNPIATRTSHRLKQIRNLFSGEDNMSTVISRPKNQSKVEHVNRSSFVPKVLKSEFPVLVDFYADWCGPCQMLGPVLQQLAREVPNARIVKVNVDQNPELAANYRVDSLPTLMVFRDGKIVAHHVGLADKHSLKQLLHR